MSQTSLSQAERSAIFREYNHLRGRGNVEPGRLNRALGLIQRADARPYHTTIHSCNCPDSQFNGVICKHRAALRMKQMMEKEKAMPVTVTCSGCGREFEVKPYRAERTDNIHCSMDCKANPDLEARFWEKVDIGDPGDCWEWQAYCRPNGYGTFYVDRYPVYAHRHAWELENEAIPEGMYVLHHCDNPSCVNPEHLFLGTQEDNIHDMMEKGRQNLYFSKRNRRKRKLADEPEEDVNALLGLS